MPDEKTPSRVLVGGELVELVSGLADASADAREAGASAFAENTLSAYRGHLVRFDRWCAGPICLRCLDAGHGPVSPWVATSVANFLAHEFKCRNLGRSSLSQCLTAIRSAYLATGRAADWVGPSNVLKGAKRVLAKTRARGEAAPVRFADLLAAVRALYPYIHGSGWRNDRGPERAIAARDRAMLLIGFLGGLRRMELVDLDIPDVVVEPEGLVVVVRGPKQEPDEQLVANIPRGVFVESDPVSAWLDWLAVRPAELLHGGPAFTRGNDGGGRRSIAKSAERIGVGAIGRAVVESLRLADIPNPDRYSSHSLRAGMATTLALAGVPLPQIANAGRWDSLDTVLRYARRARAWPDAAQHKLVY